MTLTTPEFEALCGCYHNTLRYVADVRVRKRYTWDGLNAPTPKDNTIESLRRKQLLAYLPDATGAKGKFRVTLSGKQLVREHLFP